MKNNLLDRVKYPSDLREFNLEELKQLSKELREELIDVVSITGGHLGARRRDAARDRRGHRGRVPLRRVVTVPLGGAL